MKINSHFSKIRVLVSPLDWGLGHATRCIPVIYELLIKQCEVLIAAEGATYSLLKKEFPQIKFLPLPGYRVKLTKHRSSLALKIASQIPKIISAVYFEHQWLKQAIKQYKLDAVISDNRAGLYNNKIVSVYITHQLAIKSGNWLASKIAGYIHKYFINKFDECWIPDFKNESLAGELSHPAFVPGNVKYIGALSRFEKKDNLQMNYDLLIILSGPEPQRTILEKLLLNSLSSCTRQTLLIRGLPGSGENIFSNNNYMKIINHLGADELSIAIQQSDIIICRSGYTTVMDIVKLNKHAILIATPGQAEQEYLARYLKGKKFFLSVEQKNLNLNDTLKKFSEFQSYIPEFDMEQYRLVISGFLRSLASATSS